MLLQALRWSELKRVFNQGHVEPSFAGRAPGRAGIGRADVATVKLFDKRFVQHKYSLAGGD